MQSLSSEERQQLNDSLQEMLTDKYPFEHWKSSPGHRAARASGAPNGSSTRTWAGSASRYRKTPAGQAGG